MYEKCVGAPIHRQCWTIDLAEIPDSVGAAEDRRDGKEHRDCEQALTSCSFDLLLTPDVWIWQERAPDVISPFVVSGPSRTNQPRATGRRRAQFSDIALIACQGRQAADPHASLLDPR